MRRMVNEFSSTCEECLMFNIGKVGFHPLKSIAATYPGDHWALDLGGPFTPSKRRKIYVLVIVDLATRFVWLRSLKNNTSVNVARKFYKISCEFGFPKIVQSDNDPILISNVIEEFKKLCGFDHRTISQYHPRANGAAEAHVKLTKKLLNKLIKGDWSEWDAFIPAIQMELNERVWSKNSTRPSAAMFARPFNGFKDYRQVESSLLSPEKLMGMHKDMVNVVYPSLRLKVDRANDKVAQRFNKKKGNLVPEGRFKPGHKVYLYDELATSKREPKWTGPFTIVKKTKTGAYILQDHAGRRVNRKVAPSKLKPAGDIGREFPDVRGIVDHRGPLNQREYLVLTGEEEKQVWLPARNLLHEFHHVLNYWDHRAADNADQDRDDTDYTPDVDEERRERLSEERAERARRRRARSSKRSRLNRPERMRDPPTYVDLTLEEEEDNANQSIDFGPMDIGTNTQSPRVSSPQGDRMLSYHSEHDDARMAVVSDSESTEHAQ